jgi:hypothetical protein
MELPDKALLETVTLVCLVDSQRPKTASIRTNNLLMDPRQLVQVK